MHGQIPYTDIHGSVIKTVTALPTPTAIGQTVEFEGVVWRADGTSSSSDFKPMGVVGNLTATTDPGASDDGYAVGAVWVNVTLNKVFLCADNTTSNAVWKEVGGSSGSDAAIAARAYVSSGPTTVANGVTVAVAFGGETFDTDTIHDNSTNNSRLTCKTAGIYRVSARIGLYHQTGSSDNIELRLDIRKNGSSTESLRDDFRWGVDSSDTNYFDIHDVLSLAVNDYLEIRVQNASGYSIYLPNSQHTIFEMHRIGAAS